MVTSPEGFGSPGSPPFVFIAGICRDHEMPPILKRYQTIQMYGKLERFPLFKASFVVVLLDLGSTPPTFLGSGIRKRNPSWMP